MLFYVKRIVALIFVGACFFFAAKIDIYNVFALEGKISFINCYANFIYNSYLFSFVSLLPSVFVIIIYDKIVYGGIGYANEKSAKINISSAISEFFSPTCASCGASVKPGVNICPSCGKCLKEEVCSYF